LPGVLALVIPCVVGFAFNPEALGGYLSVVLVSGVLLAIFQSNAGGAWDNAKKSFEKGIEVNGQMYYKGSEPHKASITGDTVGDPFKDTSGPSMNILIKLSAIVSLIIAPALAMKNSNTAMVHTAKTEIVKLVTQSPNVNQGGSTVYYNSFSGEKNNAVNFIIEKK
jgi:K(+)-stimulated pyrophosphate-energized sodium pump